jgi:hypothetical protein
MAAWSAWSSAAVMPSGPPGAGPVTLDPVAGAAYLYLGNRPRGVADTVAFSSDETRPA